MVLSGIQYLLIPGSRLSPRRNDTAVVLDSRQEHAGMTVVRYTWGSTTVRHAGVDRHPVFLNIPGFRLNPCRNDKRGVFHLKRNTFFLTMNYKLSTINCFLNIEP